MQQQVNVLFDDWLDNLREQGDVEVLDPELESAETQDGRREEQTMSERDPRPSRRAARPAGTSPRGARSRLRRFFLRHLPLTVAAAVVLLVLAAVGLYFVASSAAFENMVRKRLIAQIEAFTGGRTEIASFHWRLLHLEAEADGVVIHGTEDPGEAPYAQIDRLRVQLSVLGFFSPRILLRDLEIARPRLHLIVYPDGSTNQPHPRRPRKRSKSALDTLFDLQAEPRRGRAGHARLRQPRRRLRLSTPLPAAGLQGRRRVAGHAAMCPPHPARPSATASRPAPRI